MAAEHEERLLLRSSDISWVSVQQNTFTNWCNDRLRDTGYKVEDLATQFSDGITLLKLLEVLVHNKTKLKFVETNLLWHTLLQNS